MKIIYRFSFLSAVIEGAKKNNLSFAIQYYLDNSVWKWGIEKLDLSLIPDDYNGDNYDLIFDNDYNFIRAEKDLDISHKLGGK